MVETLFPFQKIGAQWLASQKVALLADEMGLGKSAQSIHACDLVGAVRICVMCTASARINWQREFEKFSYQASSVFDILMNGKTKLRPGASLISSYDFSEKILKELEGTFDVLILDEVHLLKSTDAKRTHYIFGKNGLVRRARRVWALSGTPAPNHAGELWPLLRTFGVTPLSYDDFVERYCDSYPTAYKPRITGTKQQRIPELKALMAPIILRRHKEDVMKELPPIFFSDIVVEPGPVDLMAEASFNQYIFPIDRTQELNTKMESERQLISSIIEKGGMVKDTMRALEALAKSVSTLRRYTGIQKVQASADIVSQELLNNAYRKIVIFAVHRDVIEGLRAKLSKFKPVTLYGGTDPGTRQKNIDKFQNNPKCRVFIGNIQAAGTSITLTAAHHVLFVEQDWVPGNNAQAAMRCHRIGQVNPVFVRFVGLANSLDERISRVLKQKARQLSLLFDRGGLQSAQHSDSDDSSTDDLLEGAHSEF